jgi:hypothetical protein
MPRRLTQFRWSRLVPLTGALALLATGAFAQMPMSGLTLQGEKKRALTPEGAICPLPAAALQKPVQNA